MASIILFALVFVLTCFSVLFLARSNLPFQIIDYPNNRSLHITPVPRTGGLGIWAGVFFGICAIIMLRGSHPVVVWIACSVIITGIVAFLDDLLQIPIRIRLVTHLLAAILLLIGGVWEEAIELPGVTISLPIEVGLVLSGFYIVWMTNLYNFMDGMDGFAGGMTMIGFGSMGILGYLAGDSYYASICWIVSASVAGFLVWNFPPARIFMGDMGSSGLGLMAAALSLWAARTQLFPLWLAALIFSPFIVDATLTLVRRALKGERIWEAHRNHYYQRLVQMGWSHKRTVLYEYGLMILCSISAITAFGAPTGYQWAIIGGVLLIYIIGIIGVHRLEMRRVPNWKSSSP